MADERDKEIERLRTRLEAWQDACNRYAQKSQQMEAERDELQVALDERRGSLREQGDLTTPCAGQSCKGRVTWRGHCPSCGTTVVPVNYLPGQQGIASDVLVQERDGLQKRLDGLFHAVGRKMICSRCRSCPRCHDVLVAALNAEDAIREKEEDDG